MPEIDILSLDPRSWIIIKGARVHNLKNVDLAIPRNKLVVITGLSGSGKSSLAFDTLYAEGQRRYVESLSAYARQFLGRLDKPDVDQIKGIAPAVAIEQKVTTTNPRSTVGTSTEIYDYLKLLFARVGRTISPLSGKEVKRHTVTDVVNAAQAFPNGSRAILLSPFILKDNRTVQKQLELLLQQGYTRVQYKGAMHKVGSLLENIPSGADDLFIVIDRFVIHPGDEENNNRIADSAQTAFFEGAGTCMLEMVAEEAPPRRLVFTNRFEMDGMQFEEPHLHFFSFNSPLGACKTCEGFGSVIGIDKDLVVPDKSRSVYDEAIVCWKGEKMAEWKNELILHSGKFDFPIHRPFHELTDKQVELLWTGNSYFKGLNAFFQFLEKSAHKIQYRVMLSRYRGKTTCPDCKGNRLRKDAGYVKVGDASIMELAHMPVKESLRFFRNLQLRPYDKEIAGRLLIEITNRLQFLHDVGLGYLTLMRLSNSLSGGESQRINLATSLAGCLVGSMYILDEPSIGLHPRDTERLIQVLQALRKLGNTVIVVEHDEEIMLAAQEIIDMGPMAGSHGGEVVFQGDHAALLHDKNSITARYLTGKTAIAVPAQRRSWKNYLHLKGVRQNNLKNIEVKFPLHCLTMVTGVSGSGKSSLVKGVLYPALRKMLGGWSDKSGAYDMLLGDFKTITAVEFIDQNPIGKSSRSNPVTYVKAYDEIRALFSRQQLSLINGFKPAMFSFNVAGGRCEVCEGEGQVTVEMQFMADIHLKCETCNGKRFKDEVLAVEFEGKNINDVLHLTVDEALDFFQRFPENTLCKKVVARLQPLQDVGLGYVQLGQASSTLSGGEAQRIKLAFFLSKGKKAGHTLFIFDEPTTGLHFHDVEKLLTALNALVKQGHSIIIIEHNTDMIKCADWVIDLGLEGGDAGGSLLFEGLPENLAKCADSHTGKYLAPKLARTEAPV